MGLRSEGILEPKNRKSLRSISDSPYYLGKEGFGSLRSTPLVIRSIDDFLDDHDALHELSGIILIQIHRDSVKITDHVERANISFVGKRVGIGYCWRK